MTKIGAITHLFAEAAVDGSAKNAREETEAIADTVNDGHAQHNMGDGNIFEQPFGMSMSGCQFCPWLQFRSFFLRLVGGTAVHLAEISFFLQASQHKARQPGR